MASKPLKWLLTAGGRVVGAAGAEPGADRRSALAPVQCGSLGAWGRRADGRGRRAECSLRSIRKFAASNSDPHHPVRRHLRFADQIEKPLKWLLKSCKIDHKWLAKPLGSRNRSSGFASGFQATCDFGGKRYELTILSVSRSKFTFILRLSILN